MIAKSFLVVLVLGLIFGVLHWRSNKETKERMRRGRVSVAIEDAKATNQNVVQLRAPIPYYASVKTLDEALSNYTTVIGKPVVQFSQLDADSKEIETWYKIKVTDFLSQPKNVKCASCSLANHTPSQLQPIDADEIILVRNTGTITSEGVTVTTTDAMFPDFKINQKYLFFLSFDPATRVGSLELGPAGVSAVEPDGQLTAASTGNGKLTAELKTRYGKIDRIRSELRFRRFPE